MIVVVVDVAVVRHSPCQRPENMPDPHEGVVAFVFNLLKILARGQGAAQGLGRGWEAAELLAKTLLAPLRKPC